MISLEQINGEISALEEEKPTYVLMQKLANLYVVRDHLVLPTQPEPSVIVSEVISATSNSAFMQAIDGKSTKEVLFVVDELMDALQVLNPALYNNVLRKVVSL